MARGTLLRRFYLKKQIGRTCEGLEPLSFQWKGRWLYYIIVGDVEIRNVFIGDEFVDYDPFLEASEDE